jgi:hypothetical protein
MLRPNLPSSQMALVSTAVVRTGADKSLAFPIFLFAAQPKEFLLDGWNSGGNM